MNARRLAVVALLIAAAAQPALAGVAYTPAANFTQDGVLRRSDLLLTNQDAALPRVALVRFIEEGVAGTPLPTGSTYPGLWTGPGLTTAHLVPGTTLPVGKAGMLEVFPGFGDLVVGTRLVYEKQGVYLSSADLPAITSSNLLPANGTVFLQGLEHNSGFGTLSDLGLFNLGTANAACTVDLVAGGTGITLITDAPFTVPPVSSVMVSDAFGATGLNLEVPAGSWARINCNQPFWAFGVRHNTTFGGVKLLLPFESLNQSSLTQPGVVPPLPPAGEYNFRLPGTFLTCTASNRFWRASLHDGRVAGRSFRRIVVDFDVYHHNWDPRKKTHIYMWLQNGSSWTSGLFGYLIAAKTAGVMRFQIKYGANTQQDSGGSGQPGNTYHVRYEWNGVTRRASFVMTTQSGTVRASRTINLNRTSFNANGMFFATGSWPTGEGPEALQYGWRYSNLNVDYFP